MLIKIASIDNDFNQFLKKNLFLLSVIYKNKNREKNKLLVDIRHYLIKFSDQNIFYGRENRFDINNGKQQR